MSQRISRTRWLSPRQAVWLLLRWPADLTAGQQAYLAALTAASPVIAAAHDLAQAFRQLVRDQDLPALAPWLARAKASGLAALQAFVTGIEHDRAAVEAALQLPYSNGQTEAQVLQLKAVRRQMRGRGDFDLLRRRVVKRA